MSAAIRQALADAASTVEGVTVTPYFRQVTRPGHGMVRKDRVDYPGKFGGVTTWQVFVFLPHDQESAEVWLDDQAPQLVAALTPEMTVDTVMPQQLTLDTGSVPVVLIQGIREEE